MSIPILCIPILTSALEAAFNSLLFHNHNIKSSRQNLVGKVLHLTLEELASPLVLVFSEERVNILEQYEDNTHCRIRSRIPALLKLRDRRQLPILIRCGEVVVEGDINVVEEWISLLDLSAWEPAEWLAPYIGDIASHGITQSFGKGANLLETEFRRWHNKMAETLREEWRVGPGSLEVGWFNEVVDTLQHTTENLISRIDHLEDKR
ncbi:Ubiquinone biosynthesis protein UbiJ [Serratia symbiotica]|nr:Ubiquinone biosynthesis protein UbiJ [Serratia symbiotica]